MRVLTSPETIFQNDTDMLFHSVVVLLYHSFLLLGDMGNLI